MAQKPNYIPDFWVPTQRLMQGDPVGRSFQDLANRRWTMAGMDYPSPMPIPGTSSGGYSVPGVDGDVVWNALAIPENVYPAFQIYDLGRIYTFSWSYYGRSGGEVSLVEGETSGHLGVIVDTFQLKDLFCAQTYDELTEMGAWNWDYVTTLNETASYGPLFGYNPLIITRQHWSCVFVYGPAGTIIAWAGMTWTSFWPLDVYETIADDLDVTVLLSGLEHADGRLHGYLSQAGFSGELGYITETRREYDTTLGTSTRVHERYFTQNLLVRENDGLISAVYSTPYWEAGGDTSSVPIMHIEEIPAENFRNTVFAMDEILEPGTSTVLMVDVPYHTDGGSTGRYIVGELEEYFDSVVAANDYPGDSPDPAKSYEEVVLYVLMNGYQMYTYYTSPIQLPTETHFSYTAHIGSQSWELDWPENMQLWSYNILMYDHGKYITFSWLIHTNDFAGEGYQGACLFVRSTDPVTKQKTYSMVMRYHDVTDEAAKFTVKEDGSMATYQYFAYYVPDLKMVANPVRP